VRSRIVALEYVEGGQLVIRADLPSLDPEVDIAISIAHDVLHICAHGHPGLRRDDHVSDLRGGTYDRQIALPPGTTEHHVRARYRAGQLEVRAPIGSRVSVDAVAIPITQD
jgi:HSP20 family protein